MRAVAEPLKAEGKGWENVPPLATLFTITISLPNCVNVVPSVEVYTLSVPPRSPVLLFSSPQLKVRVPALRLVKFRNWSIATALPVLVANSAMAGSMTPTGVTVGAVTFCTPPEVVAVKTVLVLIVVGPTVKVVIEPVTALVATRPKREAGVAPVPRPVKGIAVAPVAKLLHKLEASTAIVEKFSVYVLPDVLKLYGVCA